MFDSIFTHGFARAAVCVPRVRIAEPTYNAKRSIELARRASDENALIAVFPELGISAYTIDDLVQQDALLDAVLAGLQRVIEASRELLPVLVVGAPLRVEGRLFNCGVAIHRGRILGVVPKSHLPGYREFHERRHFTAAGATELRDIELLGARVPFGAGLLFDATDLKDFAFCIEICEDLWSPVPPSTWPALSGATVVANLSASNILVGKAEYRHLLAASHAARCVSAYLYAGAGPGESTTDLAWDGHAFIYEADQLLAESVRFAEEGQLIISDIDLERLIQERSRLTFFADAAAENRERIAQVRRVSFEVVPPSGPIPLKRDVARFPYLPDDPARLDALCREAYEIQARGLAQRLSSTGIEKVVLGVSGGLDSTQALIVAVRTMDHLGLPRENILGYSMPGFGTGEATRANAFRLMQAFGVSAAEIDIRPSSIQMLRDIGHPAAEGEDAYDVTFENVQAGERSSHLFRLANLHNGLVLGTGDLSEIALGWATYGVGDHMSHYNVNAAMPKTLIQYLIRWVVEREEFGAETADLLRSVLGTEISPELVPASAERPVQSTESVIGPYELQDFNLFHITRYGFRPSKVAFLARHAWGDANRGRWPELIPAEGRNEYDLPAIRGWLEVFLRRFFGSSQFKRSAMPNGPKVTVGGSLSPRGDWRAPSDASAHTWLEELRRNVPEA